MPSSPAPPAGDPPSPVTGTLGLVLPTFPQGPLRPAPAATLAAVCRRAEDAGAGALWACDHLFWHGACLEAFTALGVAAAATSRAAIGTGVLQLPLRRPAAVAKQAASLDLLAGGRLVLGVGAGSHRGEYDAAGADFSTRGRQLDDGIDALRRAWGRTEGPYALAPGARPVPVWIGGSSEAALRRAARRGDGWFPLFLGPDDYGAAMDRLDKEAERAGRDPAAVARAIVVFAAVGAHEPGERGLAWMGSLYGLPPSSFARHLVAGDAAHCARVVGRFVEAGADHVAVFVTADDPSVQFEDLAGECAPWAVAGTGPQHHQPADPLRARTV